MLPISATAASATTPIAEKPNSKKIGKAAALCTAQPSAGAIGKASARGKMRRLRDNPSAVQNSNAATAPTTALSVDAIGFYREGVLGDQPSVVTSLISDRLVRALHDLRISADHVENPQSILPDENSGAERTQLTARLVDADRPASLTKRHRSREPCETRADDFSRT